MKLILLLLSSFILISCSMGDGTSTGLPKSGVMPVEVLRTDDGKLINNTETLPYDGQWCQELDHNLRRIGSPSNCVIDY